MKATQINCDSNGKNPLKQLSNRDTQVRNQSKTSNSIMKCTYMNKWRPRGINIRMNDFLS